MCVELPLLANLKNSLTILIFFQSTGEPIACYNICEMLNSFIDERAEQTTTLLINLRCHFITWLVKRHGFGRQKLRRSDGKDLERGTVLASQNTIASCCAHGRLNQHHKGFIHSLWIPSHRQNGYLLLKQTTGTSQTIIDFAVSILFVLNYSLTLSQL